MLTKCMINPLKLARLMEWNGRLGKPSAIMAIDICNHHIGIALAYYRQHKLPSPDAPHPSDSYEDEVESNSAAITTSLSALPPIPYMSSEPYHPSYAFLHHHRPETASSMHTLDRKDRTMEVADQLAQLAIDRKVNGILVRWPGDLAGTVSGGKPNVESTREVEEGSLLFPADRGAPSVAGHKKSDGSMGYMRGRILYVLDACCTSHGHNQNDVCLESLLMEGTRPFALYDTSVSERNWIAYQQQNKHSKPVHPMIPKRCDKYGNSLTEMDLFGRAAIFGNQPPQPQHGQFRYSSKQHYFGYQVSNEFGVNSSADGTGGRSPQLRYDNFDSLHDLESRRDHFQGSLSAMHALYDFTKDNLQGRIALPLWAASATSEPRRTGREQGLDKGLLENIGSADQNNTRRRKTGLFDVNHTSSSARKSTLMNSSNGVGSGNVCVGTASTPAPNKKKQNGLVSLAQMPKRKARRRGKRESYQMPTI